MKIKMESEFALTDEDMKTNSMLPVFMDKGVESIEEQISIDEKNIKEDDEDEDFEGDEKSKSELIYFMGFDPDEFMDSLEYGDPLLG